DPNAGGRMLLHQAMHGAAGNPGLSYFDLDQLFGDGANLYAYARGNPFAASDEMGLSVTERMAHWDMGSTNRPDDPFSMVDDYMSESAASEAAFMGRIRSSFNKMAHIAWRLAQLHPAVGLLMTGYAVLTGQISGSDIIEAVITSVIPGPIMFAM